MSFNINLDLNYECLHKFLINCPKYWHTFFSYWLLYYSLPSFLWLSSLTKRSICSSLSGSSLAFSLMIASSSISFSLESFLTYLLTTHSKNLTIKLSPLENSLSKLASFSYIMLIWLSYSKILRQFELMLFLAKSFSVIRSTM